MSNNTETPKTLTWEEAFEAWYGGYAADKLDRRIVSPAWRECFKAGYEAAHEADAVRIRELEDVVTAMLPHLSRVKGGFHDYAEQKFGIKSEAPTS